MPGDQNRESFIWVRLSSHEAANNFSFFHTLHCTQNANVIIYKKKVSQI